MAWPWSPRLDNMQGIWRDAYLQIGIVVIPEPLPLQLENNIFSSSCHRASWYGFLTTASENECNEKFVEFQEPHGLSCPWRWKATHCVHPNTQHVVWSQLNEELMEEDLFTDQHRYFRWPPIPAVRLVEDMIVIIPARHPMSQTVAILWHSIVKR